MPDDAMFALVAIVAVAFSAAKGDPEPIATLDVRAWEEPLPQAEEWVDAPPMPLSREKVTRFSEALVGPCSVHDCPTCGEGLVSFRVYDDHPAKRCGRC